MLRSKLCGGFGAVSGHQIIRNISRGMTVTGQEREFALNARSE
jgi:hypothetical protein